MLIRILFLIVVGAMTLLKVQSQNININELSDKQLQQFIEKAEAGGYSEDQLLLMAKARGLSDSEIANLRTRIEAVKTKMGSTTPGGLSSTDSRNRNYLNNENLEEAKSANFGMDPFELLAIPKRDTSFLLPVFGMDVFQNKYLNFEPSLNIATPKDYQVGPGDQIVIDVWGASEQNYQMYVSPEGNIIIPGIGPIYLNGLSMEKAEARIFARLKTIYSTLGSQTFAQVSLGQIRSIKVSIVGEVVNPGTYTLSSLSTAFSALYAAGGPSEMGSLRSIQVYRSGKNVGTLDAYNFLIKGESVNIKLEDQDILLVKPYVNRVAITGQVKRPAYYELVGDESFAQLVEFAGGYTPKAYTQTFTVRRNMANSRTVLTIYSDKISAFILQGGDEINVGEIVNLFENRIRVEGAVNHPDEFQYLDGMQLADALSLAGGLRSDAFLDKGLILRQQKDYSLTSISFNPSRVIDGSERIELASEDVIRIQSVYDLRENYFITISGEVNLAGRIPYVAGMTVADLIYISNGFKETAARSQVEVARRVSDSNNAKDINQISTIHSFSVTENLQLSDADKQFELKPFDHVMVRKSPFYEKQVLVSIEGEVLYPGNIALQSKTEKISEIINRAGGLTVFAFPQGATLIRRSEYYETDGENSLDAAARIRRNELDAIFSRDTLSEYATQLKKEESIGIDLAQIMKNPGGKADLVLKEGDILSIPRELQTIRIRGEVLYPSVLQYDKTKSLKQFIAKSGGFSENALKKRVYVIYPNGSANKTSSFLGFKKYPDLLPGTEVIVPQKPEKARLSPQEILGMSSAILSMVLVIDRLSR